MAHAVQIDPLGDHRYVVAEARTAYELDTHLCGVHAVLSVMVRQTRPFVPAGQNVVAYCLSACSVSSLLQNSFPPHS